MGFTSATVEGIETTLDLLEALAGGLRFSGFADNEGRYPNRWKSVEEKLDKLLFRWETGCIEENIINAIPNEWLEGLVIDPADDKTGMRLRTLADRLDSQEKDFQTIKLKAGLNLQGLIVAAAKGTVPADKTSERKQFQAHGQTWFKTVSGGRELAEKMFTLGGWASLKPRLLPFCNAVRSAVDLEGNTGTPTVSDESVREALRSDASLVVIEAPAGCGKTHQGADYARELASRQGALVGL